LVKRNITASKPKSIMTPRPSKSHMRELQKELKIMIERFHTRYVNQVFKKLNKSTIEKFEDPFSDSKPFKDKQTGNFAKIFLQLAKNVADKLLKQYSDDRIERMVEELTSKVNNRNKQQIYSAVEDKIGISQKELEETEGLTWTINAYTAETTEWLKRLRDNTLENWNANTLRMMAEGRDLDYIMDEVQKMAKERKSNAEMVARTQVASFNSYLTKARAQNLGISKAIWETADDERVRKCHEARDGKEFDLDKGLYSSCDKKTLFPGEYFNCRCSYRLIIPTEG